MDDDGLSRATKDYAKAFFTAYGKETDLSVVAAPGVDIPGLGGAAGLKEFVRWSVHTGAEDRRQATARVRWALPGGATLDQNYSLTLEKVSSWRTDTWQVFSISTTSNEGK